MSMLIGAGNALQNFGDKIGGAMMASTERKRLEEQQFFQNMLAKRQLSMQENDKAREQANWEKERVLKLISSMPQGQGQVDQATGDQMLQTAPDLAPFIRQTRGTNDSPSQLMGLDNKLHAASQVTPGKPAGYDITRPETDAYARVMATQADKDKDRDLRRELAKGRLAQGERMMGLRMQIAQMTDATKRSIAKNALNSITSRHADMYALREDMNDATWAKADADAELEFLRINSNMMNMVPADTTAPAPPSRRRRSPSGGAPPPKVRHPDDDLIDSVLGSGTP